MGIEIERKFLISTMPDLTGYPYREIEQAYLNTSPAMRIRKHVKDGKTGYEFTYKGKGRLSHEEYNLPLDEASYAHLLEKHDGIVISKTRYLIPYGKYTIELDVFSGAYEGSVLAEVEFPTVEEADSFVPPEWFGEDVTDSGEWSNARMAMRDI